MRALFCEHPRKGLKDGYCSYYSEMFYALQNDFNITYKTLIPKKTSQFNGYDIVFLGFGHTDCGYGKPTPLVRDTDVKLYPILNKEYASLDNKLQWIENMKADAAFTVHHDTEEFTKKTGVPFHRIMWSANEKQFKNYKGDYKNSLFFSGVTRPEQDNDLRTRVLSQVDRLKEYKTLINISQ